MKKLIYSQPTAEIYELKLRGNVLQSVSPQAGQAGRAGANETYNVYESDF